MTRRRVFILVLAAVVLTLFSVGLSRRDSSDWRANRTRRLFPFPLKDLTSVTIARPDGDTVEFFRPPGGEWRIRLGEDLADSLKNTVVEDLTALATLVWREPLKGATAPDPDKAVILTAGGVGGQQVTLAFGSALGNMRAVTVDGDDSVVYGVNQDLLKFLDLPRGRYRNYNLALGGPGVRPNRVVLDPAGDDENLRLVIERTPEGWAMTGPVSWPADDSRVDMLLRWLERLSADGIAAEKSADLDWFGFTPQAARVEVQYDIPDGVATRRILFGGDAEEGRLYAMVEGRDPIFFVPTGALEEISLDAAQKYPEQWRNFYRRRTINLVGDDSPLAITIERLLPQPAKLTLEAGRDAASVKWRGTLEQGGAKRTFAVDPPFADEPMRPMTALMTGLANIRIKNFLADAAPGPDTLKWTAFPAWRISLVHEDGTPAPVMTLYAADSEGRLPPGQPYLDGRPGPAEMQPIGDYPQGAGIAFGLNDRPAVMETHAEMAYLLCLPLYRYQGAKVLDHDPRKWTRVEIVSGDEETLYTRNVEDVNEQWWRGPEGSSEPLMDDNNSFVALLLRLSQLRSPGFVAPASAADGDFGLDHPRITAIVYSSREGEEGKRESERLFALTVGKAADDDGQSHYARLDDAGPVFLVPTAFVESLEGKYR